DRSRKRRRADLFGTARSARARSPGGTVPAGAAGTHAGAAGSRCGRDHERAHGGGNMSGITARALAGQRETPILAFFLAVVVLMSIGIDGFFSINTFDNVSRQIAVICIMSVGMTLVIITGGIDLSVGAVMAFATSVGGSIAIV